MPDLLDDGKVACVCHICGESRQVKPTPKAVPRTPKGWKNKPEGFVCGKCQKAAFRLRAVDFTVAGIVSGGTWAEFLEACKAGWSQATACINWAKSTLWTSDTLRMPDMDKMPPMPKTYLYGICNKAGLFHDLQATSRQALFQLADSQYRKRRYEVIWTGEASTANARYPQPFPIPSANWMATAGPDNTMHLTFPLGGKRWTVRLLGGPMMASRIADFKRLLSGAASGGQMDILRTLESKTARVKSGVETNPETGQKQTISVKLKISGWFPREVIRDLKGNLLVRTDAQAFLVAVPEDGTREAWTLHGQQITRSVARHRRWLQAQSDDRKFERRKPKRRTAQRYNGGTGARCDHHHDVLHNWVHESTRQLVNLAARLKMACVVFTRQETCMESFPWHVWESTLTSKLDAVGIAYVGSKDKSSGEVTP